MQAEPVWDPVEVRELPTLFAGVEACWWLSGGWAIDQFIADGQATREHGDVDVSVARADWSAVWHGLRDRFDLRIAEAGGPWRLQINLEAVDGNRWLYRRDPRISRPLSALHRWSGRMRYGAPAVQLLWKAKAPTAKDEHDWAITVPELIDDERRWLARSIAAAHPRSPWADRLTRH